MSRSEEYQKPALTKRDLVVYVAGRYTGLTEEEKQENIKRAKETAIMLWEEGYTVICPHLNTANFDIECKIDPDEYIYGCITILLNLKFCAIYLVSKDEPSLSRDTRKEIGSGIPYFHNVIALDNYFRGILEFYNKNVNLTQIRTINEVRGIIKTIL